MVSTKVKYRAVQVFHAECGMLLGNNPAAHAHLCLQLEQGRVGCFEGVWSLLSAFQVDQGISAHPVQMHQQTYRLELLSTCEWTRHMHAKSTYSHTAMRRLRYARWYTETFTRAGCAGLAELRGWATKAAQVSDHRHAATKHADTCFM